MTNDPYVDAATGALVNLLGIDAADDLAVAEAEIVTARIRQLDEAPLSGDYDVVHLQAFHRQLFGDVYPWAGDFRTVNIARTAPFERLATDPQVSRPGLRPPRHRGPPEGPGPRRSRAPSRPLPRRGKHRPPVPRRQRRTQRAFFRQLARDAGWSLRWSTFTADENTAASEASLHGDNRMLEVLLRDALTPITR